MEEDKNAHICIQEIRQDINDTESDISRWEREIKGYRLIGDRMSHFRADARQGYIKDAKIFIENLKEILKFRGAIV